MYRHPGCSEYEEGSQREAAVAKAVRKLPAVHSIALAMLMGHLQRVAAHQAVNMVSLYSYCYLASRRRSIHLKPFHFCCLIKFFRLHFHLYVKFSYHYFIMTTSPNLIIYRYFPGFTCNPDHQRSWLTHLPNLLPWLTDDDSEPCDGVRPDADEKRA